MASEMTMNELVEADIAWPILHAVDTHPGHAWWGMSSVGATDYETAGCPSGGRPARRFLPRAQAVCGHDDRAMIEADLAAGVTLRELQDRYGVSRSALSRHRRHNGTSESKATA
jgi:hypothetical protein